MEVKYKLVPVEPTKEMCDAYCEGSLAPIGNLSRYGYKAMLEAVPDQLSDLEIVQNALSLEDVELTLGTGGSSTFVTNDYKESVCYFANNAELLAWAKQRLGVE